MTENKILVWDNLQKRGWSGPNRCILCKEDSETTLHLFVHCHFFQQVWHHVSTSLNFSEHWLGPSISSCFNSWCSRPQIYLSLPAIVCWNVWLARNAAIFDDKPPPIYLVTNLILNAVVRPHPTIARTKRRSITSLPFDKAIAWFDGATQLDGSRCGAGGHISINAQTSYRWTLNGGQGTNTKAELLGAWASLILAQRLNIDVMILLGDSKVIIDWINDKADLRSAALESWKERTSDARRMFKSLSASHIYREENAIADHLSKLALSRPLGFLTFSRWEEGNEGPPILLKI
jgi:ribonuclease HI